MLRFPAGSKRANARPQAEKGSRQSLPGTPDMVPAWSGFLNWLEARTGITSASKRFFYEEIPASAGWAQVVGSAALFLFRLQAFTGVLLALNYAATPGDAYDSVLYIMQEVTGGRLVRNLHHWGASAIIVVVALHALQVFVYGA